MSSGVRKVVPPRINSISGLPLSDNASCASSTLEHKQHKKVSFLFELEKKRLKNIENHPARQDAQTWEYRFVPKKPQSEGFKSLSNRKIYEGRGKRKGKAAEDERNSDLNTIDASDNKNQNEILVCKTWFCL